MRASPLELHWLPVHPAFEAALAEAKARAARDPVAGWSALKALAGHRLDFLQTARLDRALSACAPPEGAPRLRLALAGDMTLEHLVPGLRVGALRRGLALEVWTTPYGQWRQQLLDPASSLAAFAPEAALICATERDLLPRVPVGASREEARAAVAAATAEAVGGWRALRETFGAVAIQELPVPTTKPLFGHFERRTPGSPGALAAALTQALADAAAEEGALLLDPAAAARDAGLGALHDPTLWLHAKQHVHPAAVPWWGDQAARIPAALRGLARKVLVLDLDNTLWGGVIGDDGLDGIAIGEGSARGEAFKAFQLYAKSLRARGVLLAVSSKNDPRRAEAAFDHPEMALRRSDFAAFVADWNDKATGLRRIARELSLGLDSLVFFDDNPVERALVRESLPEVAVPEAPDGPERYADCLVDAGYFEAVAYTADDAARAERYARNAQRRALEIEAPDMDAFLAGLAMRLRADPVRGVDLGRVTQLINKTNQFNLTTRRYTQSEVERMAEDPDVLALCVRVEDRFGDNGVVGVVIGRYAPEPDGGRALEIDTWLMSCRVLGRRVEEAVSSVVAQAARAAGARAVLGHYRPTAKNEIVADLFARLGYARVAADASGATTWRLPLDSPPPPPPHIAIEADDALLARAA